MKKLFGNREEGQGLVEYALILVLIAIVVIIVLTLLGGGIAVTYAQVVGGLNDGQSITKTGAEVVVAASVERELVGSICTVSIPAGVTVSAIQDGQPIKDATVTVTMKANGVSGSSTTATVNSFGVGTTNGPLSASDLCPVNVSYTLTP